MSLPPMRIWPVAATQGSFEASASSGEGRSVNQVTGIVLALGGVRRRINSAAPAAHGKAATAIMRVPTTIETDQRRAGRRNKTVITFANSSPGGDRGSGGQAARICFPDLPRVFGAAHTMIPAG